MLNQLLISVGISFLAVCIALFWRLCIYTRGAIFRPVGRLLDVWKFEGSLPNSTFGLQVLRFIAMPLGSCAYCSSFHFAYETFFLMNWLFRLGLDIRWLVVIFPLSHLFVCVWCKILIHGNEDLNQADIDWIERINNNYKDREKKCNHNYVIWRRPKTRTHKMRYGQGV